jgi:two-component system sensor kinase
VRKDGSRFWANVVITALRSPDGQLVGFAKVTRDLTARREAEAQARRLAVEQAAHAEAAARSEELAQLNDRLRKQAAELQVALADTKALATPPSARPRLPPKHIGSSISSLTLLRTT